MAEVMELGDRGKRLRILAWRNILPEIIIFFISETLNSILRIFILGIPIFL